jgi:hypothetical protein
MVCNAPDGFDQRVLIPRACRIRPDEALIHFSSGHRECFGSALWWTAMILVTMGSQCWPRTGEGRLLCLLLAVYGYAVFGYITATIASFFISSDADGGSPRR